MKKKAYSYYRQPKTTAEAKANQEGWERPKRRPCNLPDSYGDLFATNQKTWKVRRNTQYYTNGRGKKHHIKIQGSLQHDWLRPNDLITLEDYCDDYNIPHTTERIKEWEWRPHYSYRDDGIETITIGSFSYTQRIWKKVYSGYHYKHCYIKHYIFTWWSNKDIGLEYILSKIGDH